MKAADLRVMMENGRLNQEVDSLKKKLQLAEGRALSISTIQEKDGNCKLLTEISWGSFQVLFGYLKGFIKQSGSGINSKLKSETAISYPSKTKAECFFGSANTDLWNSAINFSWTTVKCKSPGHVKCRSCHKTGSYLGIV